MSHQVSLKTSDGHELSVYVAEPSRTPRAGVVIVQWQSGVPVTVFPSDLALAAPFWPKKS